jgi:glycosyltransferase involved in cell wall biosynthesis
MKQLWILNHYAAAPCESGSTRHYGLARNLLSHGWNTSIIAASYRHATGTQRLNKKKYRVENVDGVSFLWLRTPTYLGNGVGRIINILSYTWRALLPISTRALPKPDVIIGSSVHPFAGVVGVILAKRFGVNFIFEVRDLWPQTLIDIGQLKSKSIMSRMLKTLELWLYNRSRKIIVLLPHAQDYIEPLGVNVEKILWIPNGVEIHSLPLPRPPTNKRYFSLMYFGAHGQANALDTVIRAMVLLQQRPNCGHVRLTMIGGGGEKQNLIALAKKLGSTNIVFKDPIPKSQIPIVAKKADAFVISVLDRPKLYRFGISMNKIYDYLAAGRPIIIGCNAINNPIDEAGAGITVSPENPQALAEAIEILVSLPMSKRVQMGTAGRQYVEANHSYRELSSKLVKMLNEVSGYNK